METRYEINVCVKLVKNASETYEMNKTAYGLTYVKQVIYKWFWDDREQIIDDKRCDTERYIRLPVLADKFRNFLKEGYRALLLTIARKFVIGKTIVLRNSS